MLIGIGLMVLALIAGLAFWFTQDGGEADILNATGGISQAHLGVGVLMLIAVGYFMTKKSKSGSNASASRGGIFGGFGGSSSSSKSGDKEGGMGPLLIVFVLVGGAIAYWYFSMQQAPRGRGRPMRGADLL